MDVETIRRDVERGDVGYRMQHGGTGEARVVPLAVLDDDTVMIWNLTHSVIDEVPLSYFDVWHSIDPFEVKVRFMPEAVAQLVEARRGTKPGLIDYARMLEDFGLR